MIKVITPTLYIGLGGTGVDVLLPVKKSLIEKYGEIPPAVEFLYFDTDLEYFKFQYINTGHTDVNGNNVSKKIYLDNHEIIKLPILNAERYLELDYIRQWLSPKIISQICASDNGARQNRSQGRFSFFANFSQIDSQIESRIWKLSNVSLLKNLEYEIKGHPKVHLVFSSGGGTGSGIFIDLVMTIRNINPDIKIYGWIMLPGCFTDYPFTNNIVPNTYAAMMEIDHLMGIDAVPPEKNWSNYPKEPYKVDYSGITNKIELKEQVFFDKIFVFDNIEKTADNSSIKAKVIYKISNILSILSSGAGDSILDLYSNNFDYLYPSSFETGCKRRNYSSAGISQIILDKTFIIDVRIHKIALRVLKNFLLSGHLANGEEIDLVDRTMIKLKLQLNRLLENVKIGSHSEIYIHSFYKRILEIHDADNLLIESINSSLNFNSLFELKNEGEILTLLFDYIKESDLIKKISFTSITDVMKDIPADIITDMFNRLNYESDICVKVDEQSFAENTIKTEMERFVCVLVENDDDVFINYFKGEFHRLFTDRGYPYTSFHDTGGNGTISVIKIGGMFPASALSVINDYKIQYEISVKNGGYHFSDIYFERNSMDLIDSPVVNDESLKWFVVGSALGKIYLLKGGLHLEYYDKQMVPLFEGSRARSDRELCSKFFRNHKEYVNYIKEYYNKLYDENGVPEIKDKLITFYKNITQIYDTSHILDWAKFKSEYLHILEEKRVLLEFGMENGILPESFHDD